MTHSDTLRGMASDERILTGRENARSTALLAGTDALDTLERVRAVLTDLRGQQEAALQRWDDTGNAWDGATSDTLYYTVHLLTEALEGES